MISFKIGSRLQNFCRAFSQIRLEQSGKYNVEKVITSKQLETVPTNNRILFSPRSITFNIETPLRSKFPLKEINDIPIYNKIIETPHTLNKGEIGDDVTKVNEILDPLINNNVDDRGVQAARLIIIRRKKMKKHKLRKLRIKMKFEWAKVRQRRELRKEKAFQAQLIGQIKLAEKFSAEQYVADKIKEATTVPIPRFWKGKRLPQFLIKEKLGIK